MTVEALASAGYRDASLIGSGGLGDVYRAVRASTGGTVAIKVVREQGDRDSTDRRVRRELEALLRLKGHPNVVQVEELLALPTGLALVMEFVAGGSLMDLVKQKGPVSAPQAVVAMAEVTRALSDAHSMGMVHRDVKPHNVMIGQFGQCKVCDFGIAAVLKDSSYTDRTSALSYRYASPEELEESSSIGPPTDMYSLGVTLRHLLSGETNHARALAVHDALASAPGTKQHNARVALMHLVERLTAVDPAARPAAASVLSLLHELDHNLGDERVGSVLQAPGSREDDTARTIVRPAAATPAPAPPPPPPSEPDDRTVVRPRSSPDGSPPRKPLPSVAAVPEKWWEPT